MSGSSSTQWIDTHCHIHDHDDAEGTLEQARAAGVGRLICIGTDAARSAAAVAFAAAHAEVWATVGLHPHSADHDPDAATIAEQARCEKGAGVLVGIGECGLDYHYDYSSRAAQQSAFGAQVRLANELGCALVVHTREAWEDTWSVLEAEGVPERLVIHCFTGGVDEARRCLALGAWLSFSGIVTFRSAPEVREAAAFCPADRLLVETDSPYLAPVPHRGKPNSPAFVPLVGEAVAEARHMSAEAVAELVWENAEAAFGLSARERSSP